MKTKSLVFVLTFLFAFGLFVSTGFAQLFGGGSDENVSAELKKLNARLVENLIPEVGGLKNAQNDLVKKMAALNSDLLAQQKKLVDQMNRFNEIALQRHNELAEQVSLLRNSIASLQGSIEQNQLINQKANAKLDGDMEQMKTQMDHLESTVTNELKTQFTSQIKALNLQADQQNARQKAFMDTLVVKFDELRTSAASDMELLARQNAKAIQEGIGRQEQRIEKIMATMEKVAQLEAQNAQVLTSGVQTLKQNDQEILTGLNRVDGAQKIMQEKNQKLIDILSGTLTQQQNTLTKIDQLATTQQSTKQDFDLIREAMKTLKDILDKRLAETSQAQEVLRTQNQQVLQQTAVIQKNQLVSDDKMNKLADGLKTIGAQNTGTQQQLESAHQKLDQVKSLAQQTDEKFARLVDTTKSMLTHTSQVSAKMDQVAQKVELNGTKADLSEEKLSRLVEILKAIASEQDKFTQLLGNQNLINKNIQTMASDIQRSVTSSQQQLVNSLTETHKEFRDRLEDLRRKGNVIIARNDDILKIIQK